MEEAFGAVVMHVFNSWSALKLAVEHSMGGPNSKQVTNSTLDPEKLIKIVRFYFRWQ